jgi:hypothetical protein
MLHYFGLLEDASPVIEELLFWLCFQLKLVRSSTTFVRHVHWVAWQTIILNDRALRYAVRQMVNNRDWCRKLNSEFSPVL